MARLRIVKHHEGCYELQVYSAGRKWLRDGRLLYPSIDKVIDELVLRDMLDSLENDIVELPHTHGGLTPREQ